MRFQVRPLGSSVFNFLNYLEIIKTRSSDSKKQVIELEKYINKEECQFSCIIYDLNEKKAKEKLYQPESQLLYKCDQIEKEIQNLQEYINCNYDAPQNELIQKELIMIKSLEPIL